MVLAASIQSWKHCKPILVVDGTFLEATHGGTLIVAFMTDANENILLLAFSIVDSENNLAYEWVLETSKQHLENVKICASSRIVMRVLYMLKSFI